MKIEIQYQLKIPEFYFQKSYGKQIVDFRLNFHLISILGHFMILMTSRGPVLSIALEIFSIVGFSFF
jgi:hypothetical protein